jgi:Arc/MetJ-type ribon-helix-helix transcriptional regulator
MKVAFMVRRKVSVTVDEELVEWMDNLIQRNLFRNRSHVMEEALKHMKQKGIKRILLEKLEGGEGQ